MTGHSSTRHWSDLIASRPVRFRRIKRWAAALLCSRASGLVIRGLFGDTIPWRIGGPPVKVPIRAHPTLVASIFWGLYESAEVRFVRRYLDPDRDCLELGSGIGLVSRVIAEVLGPGRRLVCVEPREDLLVCARENVDCLVKGLQCSYIAAVISRNSSSAAMFPELADWINARMGGAAVGQGERVVRAVTLREVAENFPGRFQIVSDIEGGEVSFLDESCADVLRRVDRLIIELHETEAASVDELIGRTVTVGFRLIDRYGPVCVFVRG